MISLADLQADLQAILPELEQVTDPAQLAKLSQDYYAFSPILQPIFELG
jgi:hypothetical protein